MHRAIFTIVEGSSALTPLLADWAIKGTVLLALAALAALLLRRDSAATRHLVWLLAMVALLLVPALSALLPQWRVLPAWAALTPAPSVGEASPPPLAGSAVATAPVIRHAEPDDMVAPPAAPSPPVAPVPDATPPDILPAPAIANWMWQSALPLAWTIGVTVLLLRLLAARWMFWHAERQAAVLGASAAGRDPLATALQAARSQLGIHRPVTLLVHAQKTIPVVWGILHCRLLLPGDARHWAPEQLRSVLLHELAHVKRRDLLVQLLTQISCALHWFNPLAWFAAWRLGVERERACDDLVLASGVRPSAYAGHLLKVVTGLAPARWVHSCGLAMARTSSLESRLVAVLSDKLNRRRVSTALAMIALAVAIGVAVPIAMLRAAAAAPVLIPEQDAQKPKDGEMLKSGMEETDKLVTGETSGAAAAGNPEPKNKQARELFNIWQRHARKNGDIPGGLVGLLGDKVKEFIRNNTGDLSGDPHAKKMAPLVPRIDAAHDWKPAEAAALMDDIAAVTTIPLETTMLQIGRGTIATGTPLPKQLTNAPWGPTQPSGLRLAWLLEPRAAEYRIGTPLKSRLLFHNAGKNDVVFRARSWHQSSAHKAHDATGNDINVDSTSWTTRSWLTAYRLAPGEYVEVAAAGIGVGANKRDEDWQNTRVGAWIDAKAGDDVTFTPAKVPASDWNEVEPMQGEPGWWLDFIQARLARETPLPADAAERTRLLDHAMRDLVGATPTPVETATFVGDRQPMAMALEALAKRLAQRPGVNAFSGPLTSGVTRFRVLPPDPDAAKKPRTASGPGRYNLGDLVGLEVSRRPVGERIVNEASIHFYSADPTKPAPGKPHKLKLPDGYDTWAAAWLRGQTVLWVMQKGTVRSYDFTDPANVKETAFDRPASLDTVPRPIVDALRAVLDTSSATSPGPATPKH